MRPDDPLARARGSRGARGPRRRRQQAARTSRRARRCVARIRRKRRVRTRFFFLLATREDERDATNTREDGRDSTNTNRLCADVSHRAFSSPQARNSPNFARFARRRTRFAAFPPGSPARSRWRRSTRRTTRWSRSTSSPSARLWWSSASGITISPDSLATSRAVPPGSRSRSGWVASVAGSARRSPRRANDPRDCPVVGPDSRCCARSAIVFERFRPIWARRSSRPARPSSISRGTRSNPTFFDASTRRARRV